MAPLGEHNGVEDVSPKGLCCGDFEGCEEGAVSEELEVEERRVFGEKMAVEEEPVEEMEEQETAASNRNRLTFVDSTSGDEGELTRDK